MKQPEKVFNLLDEPWIRVITSECKVEEVSLQDALYNAHKYKDLAGELKTQDIAVLRLLLAVLHSVFSKVDETGAPDPILDEACALNKWKTLWDLKQIPEAPIRKYLAEYHEKFWLFHPTAPFYQTYSAAQGTEYSAAKLNGTMCESGNKPRLFQSRVNQAETGLSFSEAARWLLNVNAFDDTSAKPKGKNLPSAGAGWLGKLGLIITKGENLFETLMLNLTLLRDGEFLWEEENLPVWALETPRGEERVEIPVPLNPAALLTLQSRRLLLKRKKDRVVGYFLLGGDFFPKANAYSEQMTVWKPIYEKKEVIGFQPRRHDSARQLWRDFPFLFRKEEDEEANQRVPGVISWVSKLQDLKLISGNAFIRFCIASVQYGDKDFFVTDIFSDSVSVHVSLLSNLSNTWQAHVLDEVSRLDSMAWELGRLTDNLSLAGHGTISDIAKHTRARFYAEIDIPFRKWLSSIAAEEGESNITGAVQAWRKSSKKVAITLAKKLIDTAGPAAFVGRTATDNNGNEKHYCAPEAFNWFLYNITKLD